MTVQPANDTPPSLWRERATQWLQFTPSETPIRAADPANENFDPDPPPAAPALRPWPRVFPQL